LWRYIKWQKFMLTWLGHGQFRNTLP
jgi:hypothetical protein